MISCEVLAHGNIEREETLSLAQNIKSILFNTSRILPAAYMPRNRRVALKESEDVAFTRPIDNINSAIQLSLQLNPLSDVNCGVLALLFNQVIADHFFDQLRTKEQLGYIVSHRYKEDAGSYSLTFLVQSTKSPAYLYTRIQLFLDNVEALLEKLTPEEFDRNVEALSHLLTKKHNNLGEETGMILDALIKGHYNFEKRTLFNGLLKGITKSDLVMFYKRFIQDKSQRKQFSIFIESAPKSAADLECTKKAIEADVELPSTLKIFDFPKLPSWKASRSLLPLPEDKSV